MKPNKLKKNYQIHQDKQNITREELLRLKQKYEQSSKMQLTIHQTAKRNENMMEKGLLSSFRISLLIAKSGKPHTIGESLLNPVIKEVLENMVGTSSNTVLQSLPFSNDTVKWRIDEMGADVEEQLCSALRKTEFSFQVDESTVRDNEAMLLTYVRFRKDDQFVEEMLFARLLETDTKGESIFNCVRGIRYTNEEHDTTCNGWGFSNGRSTSRIRGIHEERNTGAGCHPLRYPQTEPRWKKTQNSPCKSR